MSLKTSLVWHWDLDTNDSKIADQKSGLVLDRTGTVSLDATGAPDGGPCIVVGAGFDNGYFNSSVEKLTYESGFTANIWVYTTEGNITGNWVFFHRSAGSSLGLGYWQILTQRPLTILEDRVSLLPDAGGTPSIGIAAHPLEKWQMLTLRYDGGYLEIYRDGVLGDSIFLGSLSFSANNQSMGIGRYWASASSNLQHIGRLAMASVWDRPLEPEELLSLYDDGNGRRYSRFAPASSRRRMMIRQQGTML